ncbi:hypothetical protein [Sphaerisporangium corydalis]|uniref:Uncharacterized protein n=1 Tax=Sphaerisporangium corydalis TaxID=1441875 RepID=A0ABV9ESK4_9ACTN|nr:hypothetical protein [Sphaerisporangium corydalis]
MQESRSISHRATTPTGWRVFRSSAGRFWATRERAYDEAGEASGAWRTVDADDEIALCRAIAEQEARAELARFS